MVNTLRVDCVRIADNYLTVIIDSDSHGANQITAFGDDGLSTSPQIDANHAANSKVAVRAGYARYVDVVGADSDGL